MVGAAVVVAACGATTAPVAPPAAPPDTFAIDGAQLRQTDAKLAEKVGASPFAFFRYQNRAFGDRVCARWASSIATMPLVHVHGDAHIEQYAVAESGRGLADFDASGEGPPVLDFARFSASIVLARQFDRHGTKQAIKALFKGYEKALDDPTASIPEPHAATRLRSHFAPTTEAWLDRCTSLIVPTPPQEHERFVHAWKTFVGEMCQANPPLTEAFFTVKIGGKLDLGIGSAHTAKYLARIEGPSPSPADDVMLEAKALEPGVLPSCMRSVALDATRVIETQAQMSTAPQRFLGAMTINDKPFYTHAWQVQYTELSIDDVKTADELEEIAEDVGLQLGRGHAKTKDLSKAPALRRALKAVAKKLEPEVEDESFELAREVSDAWVRFRDGG